MSKKLTKKQFIEKAKTVHNYKYIYEKVIYITSAKKVIIICKRHGEFLQSPNKHLQNKGCYKCGREAMGEKQRLTTLEFIKKAKIKHENKYNYNLVDYKSAKEKVNIICKIHGMFRQTPNNHLNGSGCDECVESKLSISFINARDSCDNKIFSYQEFTQRAIKKHGNQYDYSKSVFTKGSEKVEIICMKHGSFYQTPIRHCNSGYGCPKCIHVISKSEIRWLNYLNIDETYRQKTLKVNNKKYKIDAFDPNTNTIYEFHGDYWHGNPKRFNPNDLNKTVKKTFGELYQKTIDRENELKALGYNVISIWESDWNKIKNIV